MNEFQSFLQILKESKASFVLLLCHRSADADAICSAYALQGLLKRFMPDVVFEVGCPQGVNKPSKVLLERMPITVNLKPNIESADVIVFLDLNTIDQLDQVAETIRRSPAPKIIVDHHYPSLQTTEICKLCILDQRAAANCEIVYNLYRQAKVKPNFNEAKALFVGITFDTRHFALASAATLAIAAKLVTVGIDVQATLQEFALPIDTSERLAKLKACKRAKIVRVSDWIIAVSHVSAYQAAAAKSLVDLGAHASAVAGLKSGKIDVSLRCTRQFTEETGINLGKDIAAPLGEFLQGVGGGHAMAAGVSGEGEIEPTLKQCLTLMKQILRTSHRPPSGVLSQYSSSEKI
ncbi:MAG TPA: DHH family phosphoesterase [Candidatus Acidoferrales bacterium]|nr:DHH family phosphoesterase [Candidatus Acidoferrales bacterium]